MFQDLALKTTCLVYWMFASSIVGNNVKAPKYLRPAHKTKYCGIKNSGNNCFINASLQAIFNLDNFRQTVLESQNNGIYVQLRSIFGRLSRYSGEPIEILRETIVFRNSFFQGRMNTQEDASEFLMGLLATVNNIIPIHILYLQNNAQEIIDSWHIRDARNLIISISRNRQNNLINYVDRSNLDIPEIPNFKLKSIVSHIGSVNSGHYYATCNKGTRENPFWVEFNDSEVSVVDINKIDNLIKQASILVYEREQ